MRVGILGSSLVLISLVFSINCANTTHVAVEVEKNIHTYLGAFRTEFRARCSEANILSTPCETVRLSWIKVLEVGIAYDEALLSGKIDQETLTNFRNAVAGLINTINQTDMTDLKPNLAALLGAIK